MTGISLKGRADYVDALGCRLDRPLAPDGPTMRPGGVSLTDRAVRVCGFEQGALVADVGCGTGSTVEYLLLNHHMRVLGLDPSSSYVEAGLARTPALPLTLGVAEALPIGNGILDGLFCECVLSLLGEVDAALSEFSRTVKPGGLVVISDLYDRSVVEEDRRTQPCLPEGIRSREEMERLLSKYAFSPVSWEDHTFALKEFAAQMILAGDGCEQSWLGPACTGASRSAFRWLGYFLLIGRRS